MTMPDALSRLQHDLSLSPGIPDSYRLFGEGPTVSTYGDLREVVRQLDVRHLTSAERAWGEEAASVAISAVPPSQGMDEDGQPALSEATIADLRRVAAEDHARRNPDVTGLVEAARQAALVLEGWAEYELHQTNRESCARHPWHPSAGVSAYELELALAAFQSRQEEG